MENQVVQNPTPEPTLTPVQVSEPKAKFPVMYLVLSLLILVLLTSTAFLYYQNIQLRNMLASYQQVQVSPTPSSISVQASPSAIPSQTQKPLTNSGTVEQGNVKISIIPNFGPVGTKVKVTISGIIPNPNAPYADLSFMDDQGPGEDSLTNQGIDTRNFTPNQPYVTTYTIPENVLVAAVPNAQEPTKKVPTHIGADSIVLSYQDYDAYKAGTPSDKEIKIPFTVTSQ